MALRPLSSTPLSEADCICIGAGRFLVSGGDGGSGSCDDDDFGGGSSNY